MELKEGDLVDSRYRIDHELARGGMGIVYKAHDVRLRRNVAVKILIVSDPIFFLQFREKDIWSLAQLNHPGIVLILDAGERAGVPFAVYEFVDGEPLSSLVGTPERDPRAIGEAKALRITMNILHGLQAAHDVGFVHRDMKPQNIMLSPKGTERVKILDFGLVKTEVGPSSIGIAGTPWYMSPEQCDPRLSIDSRSDIYSMGIVLFQLLTGSVPFVGSTRSEVYRQHLQNPPADVRTLTPTLSLSSAEAVTKALEKDPARRFQTCNEFASALARASLRLDETKRDESALWGLDERQQLRKRADEAELRLSELRSLYEALESRLAEERKERTVKGPATVENADATTVAPPRRIDLPPQGEVIVEQTSDGFAFTTNEGAKTRALAAIRYVNAETGVISVSSRHRLRKPPSTSYSFAKQIELRAGEVVEIGAAGDVFATIEIHFFEQNGHRLAELSFQNPKASVIGKLILGSKQS